MADEYHVTREEMDAFAFQSQQKAVRAVDGGRFQEEIVPITVKGRKGDQVYDTDEYPRRDVTLESLSNLKAAFQEGGRVTAGNASGMNDAAAGILLMEEEKAKEAGAPIMARIQSVATTGVEPELMGIGPISASQKALAKAGLTIDDIDLFEINEAFAAQCIACQKTLGIPEEKLNVNGSGISLGHPVGATGARLVVTLIHELAKRKQRYGLATLCAGGGMGTAIIVEMV